MLARIAEACITVVFLVLTFKEIIFPLLLDRPLFPMIRKTMKDYKEDNK